MATQQVLHTLGLGSAGSLPGLNSQGRRDFQVRGLLSPTGSVTICFREAGRSGAALPKRQLEGRSWLSRFCSHVRSDAAAQILPDVTSTHVFDMGHMQIKLLLQQSCSLSAQHWVRGQSGTQLTVAGISM